MNESAAFRPEVLLVFGPKAQLSIVGIGDRANAAGDSFPHGLRPAARFGVRMQSRYSSVDKDSGLGCRTPKGRVLFCCCVLIATFSNTAPLQLLDCIWKKHDFSAVVGHLTCRCGLNMHFARTLRSIEIFARALSSNKELSGGDETVVKEGVL
jgi:hypothetical protein